MDYCLIGLAILFLAAVAQALWGYFRVLPSQEAATKESKALRSELELTRQDNAKLQRELQATRKELADTRESQDDLQEALAICNASHMK